MRYFSTILTTLFSFLLFSGSSVFQKEIPENRKGRSAYEKEDYSDAENHFSSGIKRKNSPELFYNLGNSLYRQNKKDEALDAYKKALENNPSKNLRSDILSNMGNVFAEKQKFDKAASLYERSLKMKPDRNTATNLEIVRRLLQEKEKEQKRKNEQDDKNKDEEDENQKQCEKDGTKEKDEENEKKDKKKDKEKNKQKSGDNSEKNESDLKEKTKEKDEEKTEMENILREFENRKNLQITPFMLKEEGKTEGGQRW